MQLSVDLYDVYGKKIAEKGAVINSSFVQEIIKKGRRIPKRIKTVDKTPLIRDFKKALKDKRYHMLFKSSDTQKYIIKTFSRLKLTESLRLELKQMKEQLPDTYHHVLIMSALVIKMIGDIKMAEYDPEVAASLCLTHDIGKTRIPKKILNKKSALTESEYNIIQTHPLIGFLLLSYYIGNKGKQFCETAFEHHEKLDGSGYPRGIKKVDRYAQLIEPVDIYDALISKRPYRQMSYNGRLALDLLLEDAGMKKLNRDNILLLINSLRKNKVASLAHMNVSKKRRTAPPTGNSYGKIKKDKARRLLKKD